MRLRHCQQVPEDTRWQMPKTILRLTEFAPVIVAHALGI
jgi:hypothetical protein